MKRRWPVVVVLAVACVLATAAFLLTDDDSAPDGPLTVPCRDGCDEHYGVAVVSEPGQPVDSAEVVLTNPTEQDAVLETVTVRRGAGSPAVRLLRTRTLGPDRAPDSGEQRGGSGHAEWRVDPLPAKGSVVPSRQDDPRARGVALLLTLEPTVDGMSWISDVTVTYRIGEDRYTDHFPTNLVLCSRQFSATGKCRSDPWNFAR
jgi:hypothetical protein